MSDPSERRAAPRPQRPHPTGFRARAGTFWRELGPGLITGAADDDPSGIATYSQAGAAFGFGLLWTALVSLPLMAAVQLMCARLGIVTHGGLARVLRRSYSRPLLWLACLLLLIGNTVNIAADLSGMAAAAHLLTGVPTLFFVPVFTGLILVLLIYASYQRIMQIFKWMTLVLFTYMVAGVLAQPDWGAVIMGTLVPKIQWSSDYLLTFVALLGTTISPYLFFWQAAQTAEQHDHIDHALGNRPRRAIERELRDVKDDVYTGMFISNLIMYFIILTTGATLHPAGITDVQTPDQAAAALAPFAGNAASLLFSMGLVGTGMLGVPVLAGSAAYAVAEAASWRRGMDETIRSATHFYGVIIVAMLAGMVLCFLDFNPIKLLFWAAVINGLLAPPLIVIILVVCNNAAIMGAQRNRWGLNLLGGLAALVMGGAAVALIASWIW